MATLVDVSNLSSMYEIYQILEGLGLAADGFYQSSNGTRECIFKLAFGSSGKWIRIANVSGAYRPIFLQYGIGDNVQKTWTYQGRLGGNTDSYNNVYFDRIAVIGGNYCFGIWFSATRDNSYHGLLFVGTMENGDTVSFLGGETMGVTFLDHTSDGKGNVIFEQRPILKGGQVCYTPIPIVSSDYKFVSTLKGADNACLYSLGSPLSELDGYNVVFFPNNNADTTSASGSSAHAKWTGFRIL